MKITLPLLGVSLALSITGFAQLSLDSDSSSVSFSRLSDHHFGEDSRDLSFSPNHSVADTFFSRDTLTSPAVSPSPLPSVELSLFGSLSGWEDLTSNFGVLNLWTSSQRNPWGPVALITTLVENNLLSTDQGNHLKFGFIRLENLNLAPSESGDFPSRVFTRETDSNENEVPWTSDPLQVYRPVSIADAYSNLSVSF